MQTFIAHNADVRRKVSVYVVSTKDGGPKQDVVTPDGLNPAPEPNIKVSDALIG